MKEKILNILKWITSPIWYPWKLLFIRKEERKFKNVDTKTKIFRILRSFITKPLKFCLYLTIIAIEVLLVYKVRFSVLTYPITRQLVHNYYIQNVTPKEKLLGIEPVNASDLSNHKDQLTQAFKYIDKWDLSEKNKMYVLLDAKITKILFKYTDQTTINYILDRFNNDITFRNDVKYAVKNVNKTLARGITDFPVSVHIDNLNTYFAPILSLSVYTVDYREVLDLLGMIVDLAMEDSELEVTDDEASYTKEEVYLFLDMAINYSKGMSMEEAYEIANNIYLEMQNNEE